LQTKDCKGTYECGEEFFFIFKGLSFMLAGIGSGMVLDRSYISKNNIIYLLSYPPKW
jgi:hypothetical protein